MLAGAALFGQVAWAIARRLEEVAAGEMEPSDTFTNDACGYTERDCKYLVACREFFAPGGEVPRQVNVGGPDGSSVGGHRLWCAFVVTRGRSLLGPKPSQARAAYRAAGRKASRGGLAGPVSHISCGAW